MTDDQSSIPRAHTGGSLWLVTLPPSGSDACSVLRERKDEQRSWSYYSVSASLLQMKGGYVCKVLPAQVTLELSEKEGICRYFPRPVAYDNGENTFVVLKWTTRPLKI